MPVYEYKGTHYELPDGLSPEQAKMKIKRHLGDSDRDPMANAAANALSYIPGAVETFTTGAVDAGAQLMGKVGVAAHAALTGRDMSAAQTDFDELYGESKAHKYLEPQSHGGKKIAEVVGHGIEKFKDAVMEAGQAVDQYYGADEGSAFGGGMAAIASAAPELAMIPLGGKGGKMAMNRPDIPNPFKKAKKGLDVEAAKAALEEAPAADRPTSPFEANPNGGAAAFNDMAVGLAQEKASPVSFPSGDSFGAMAEQLGPQREQARAQAAIAARQREMELEVQRQQGLDFNAAERARQEKATNFLDEHNAAVAGDRAIGATAEGLVNPADRMQRQLRREQVPTEGESPLYVTPDKQVLNVRPDDMAMEALRRQKEAGQNALDYGIREKRKEPLSLLQDKQMRISNDGPQVTAREALDNGMVNELAHQAALEHPLVIAAERRLAKAEELLIKASEEGKATRFQLKRLQQDIENLTQARDKTIVNVSKAKRDGKRATPFNFKKQGGGVNIDPIKTREPTAAELELKRLLKKDVEENRHTHTASMFKSYKFEPEKRPGIPQSQRGAINPEVFKEGFEKLKKLADGTWLRAHSDGQLLRIEARRDGHIIGNVEFNPRWPQNEPFVKGKSERNLEADMVSVLWDHRGKGYAPEMYKFASELGNDIKASSTQTEMGRAMWDKFEQTGMSEKGSGFIPKGQRGAIDPDMFIRMFPEFARSAMVDAAGKLKKFYHGTSKDKHFDDINANTRGAWFTDNPKEASSYAKTNDSQKMVYDGGRFHEVNTASRVHEVYLNIENPYRMTEADISSYKHASSYAKWQRDFFAKVKSEGHDGVDFGDGIVIAFDKSQIKSAIAPENKTKFPKGQKGALLIDPSKEPAKKVLDNIPGIRGTLKSLAPSQWNAEQAKAAVLSAVDVTQNKMQEAMNIFTKGGQYMAHRLNDNPLFAFGNERLQNAERLSRADVANYLHDVDYGLNALARKMSPDEHIGIWTMMDIADKNQRTITADFLRAHGASEAQIKYAEAHRKAMDYAYERFNKELESLGHKPVSKRVGYAAMMANGDFRGLVRDASGDVVGMIGSDFKPRYNYIAKELAAKGYTVDKPKYMGGEGLHVASSAERQLGELMQWFAQNDPRIEQLLDTVGEINSQLTQNYLNMDVHTKAKKGIFGMEGRKSADGVEWGGNPVPRNVALANAREGLRAQSAYFEMAVKWGHLIEQLKDVREVMKDKEVSEKMPNAKLLTQEYINKALGYNPTKMGQLMEGLASSLMRAGTLDSAGISTMRKSMAVSRQLTNGLLLGFNPMFWMTNVVQPFQAMPGMKAMLESRGLSGDFDLGTGYRYIGRGAKTALDTAVAPGKLTGLEKEAYNYARSRHVYGSDLIEHSNHVHKGVGYWFEKTTGAVPATIEAGTRAPMFYAFVHMLNENGMSTKNGLFEAAHNLTDMAMNNYSRTERPMLYDAMGPVGEVASNLASYKHNELSRTAMFAREFADGHYRPLAAQLATNIAFAGVKGVIGYNAVDWFWKHISEMMGKPSSLTKELMNASKIVGDMTREGINNTFGTKMEPGMGRYALSHGIASAITGWDFSNRLGLNDAFTPNIFPGGNKLLDIASEGLDFAKKRDEASAKKFAYAASPLGPVQGAEELHWFSKENGLGLRHADWTGQVKRTDKDKMAKAIGGTGLNEAVKKQSNYENQWIDVAYDKLRDKAMDKARGEIAVKGSPSQESFQAYLKARGDVGSWRKFVEREQKRQNTQTQDREIQKGLRSNTPKSRGHLNDILESNQ